MRSIAFEEGVPDRKSIVVSRSFGRPIETLEEMRQAIVTYATLAAGKLRRQGLAVGVLQVFVTTNPEPFTGRGMATVGRRSPESAIDEVDRREEGNAERHFRATDRQRSAAKTIELPVATSDTGRIASAAAAGIEAIWRDRFKHTKCGVMLLDLVKAASVGDRLFDRADGGESKARMRAMDAISMRFGRGTVGIAGAGLKMRWAMRRERMSRRYTTSVDEVLEVGETPAGRDGALSGFR